MIANLTARRRLRLAAAGLGVIFFGAFYAAPVAAAVALVYCILGGASWRGGQPATALSTGRRRTL